MEEGAQLTIKIVRKIEEISPEDWLRVFPDILENYYFFKTSDESNFERFSFYYILVYQKDEVVGCAPCFYMDYPLDTTIQSPLKHLSNAVRKIFPNLLNLRAVVCGSPACEGRIGIAAEDKLKILEAVSCALEQIAKDNKASVIAFKDFSPDYTQFMDYLIKKGFYKLAGYPSVEINMRFRTFEEYLKNLSHANRKSLRRKFRRAEKLPKIDCRITNDLGELLDAAYGLYLQTFSKSEIHFEEYTKDFLKNISKNMPNEVKYFLWSINGRLVAFNLCLASKDALVDEFLGLDYSVAYKYSVYFITWRDILTWCIENGIKKYESGALAYETKRRLGCKFVPVYIYVKHMNKFINPFFKILCILLKPENFDVELKTLYR
jgi:predicted N-acyltransferase